VRSAIRRESPVPVEQGRLDCMTAACLLLVAAIGTVGCSKKTPVAPSMHLAANDESFLEDLSHRSFRYFDEQTDPGTGLTRDRARARGEAPPLDPQRIDVASIAATGFGLSGLCIAAKRGWIPAAESRARIAATLRFFAERAPQEHGWFFHWMDARTGERVRQSEVSTIDTALLFGGILTARQSFPDDPEIHRLATSLYERLDFPWMLNGHPTLLSHGWRPEQGFLKSRWDHYSEHALLDLLGIGSPTHPLGPATWRAWERRWITYGGYTYLTGARALFVHQYSHAWIDFRDRREEMSPQVDYFANSVAATRAHRLFCIDLSTRFPSYSEDIWGITSSDSVKGYVAWGGPPAHPAIDGTVVPCAAAGSLMFTPDISIPALKAIKDRFGDRVWGRYGFVDAFNPVTGWTGPDVIGIDVGITLLSAENLRSEAIWKWFMANKEVVRALDQVGLRHPRTRGTDASAVPSQKPEQHP